MSESLRVTIVYEEGEDGWIVASIPEVPGAHSQGRTCGEARTNVIDALRGILELAIRRACGYRRSRRQRTARARHRRVKRRDLERHLRAQGAERLREGGNHSNPAAERVALMPNSARGTIDFGT